jgi:hypothetical protein
MHKTAWKEIWRAVVLTALLPLGAGAAGGEPGVLVIDPRSTNRPADTTRKLVDFTAEGPKEIAELNGHVIFGADEDSAAFLMLDGHRPEGGRLVVVDRKTLAVIADTNLPGVHSISLKVLTAEQAGVWSKGAMVVCQIVDEHGFGFIQVNWKTGSVVRRPNEPKGYPVQWTPIPSGYAVSTFDATAAYDGLTHKELALLSGRGDPSDWRIREQRGGRQVYFVPGMGLMEYYYGTNVQLTDANLSTALANPVQFSSAQVRGKVFVADAQGKPLLIWGENKEPKGPGAGKNTITEIVIFDPVAKKEVLRRPLGGSFPENFRPNQDGTKIYLIKPENEEIFCLDLTNQAISSFAMTGFQPVDEFWSGFAIVAAD